MSTQVLLRKATEKELIGYIRNQDRQISSLQEELKTFNDELKSKQNKERVRGKNQFTDAMYIARLPSGPEMRPRLLPKSIRLRLHR